jgi:hypothetical protein
MSGSSYYTGHRCPECRAEVVREHVASGPGSRTGRVLLVCRHGNACSARSSAAEIVRAHGKRAPGV